MELLLLPFEVFGWIVPLAMLLFYAVVMPILLFTTRSRLAELERQLNGGAAQTARRQKRIEPDSMMETGVEPVKPKKSSAKAVRAAVRTRETSFEERVGGHWFQWLGVGALVFALLFFLKWSFDNGWIGPVGRTLIGYLLCAAAMAGGDRLQNRYGKWSLTFTGGGALGAFIVTWIGLHTYHLFPSPVAFIIYVLITVITCGLSGYYGSIPLAVFGIVGGFVTPLLTDQSGSTLSLLLYIVILNIGVLALAHVQKWRILQAVTLLGTLAYEAIAINNVCWTADLANGCINKPAMLFFILIFFGIYAAMPVVYNMFRREKGEAHDVAMLTINAIIHFGFILWWLSLTPGMREQWDAGVSMLFACLFGAMSAGLYRVNRNDTPMILAALGLTILFAALMIPLQFGGVWVPLAWSIEGAFLMWMALELKDKRMMPLAFGVMILAYMWYMFVPTEPALFVGRSIEYVVPSMFLRSGIVLFVGWAIMLSFIGMLALRRDDRSDYYLLPFMVLSGVILIAAYWLRAYSGMGTGLVWWERLLQTGSLIGGSYAVLFQAQKHKESLSDNERNMFAGIGIMAQLITLAYLTDEFVRAVNEHRIFANVQRPHQILRMGTSILWAVYSSVTLVAGMKGRWRSIRIFSIVVLLIATLKLAVFDFFDMGTGARVIGFTALGVILVAASFLYQRNKDRFTQLLK